MNKGKVGSVCKCTVIASCQVLTSIGLEHPLSIRLSDGLPLRVRFIRSAQMSEGRVRIGSSEPTVVASGEIVSIWCPQGNFVTYSENTPRITVILHTNSISRYGSSDIGVDSQELSIIGLESDSWKTMLTDFPQNSFIINIIDKSKVAILRS